jgi:large subunit ribosomal protein L10
LAISKEKKQELIANYAEKLARSEAVIFTDYRGLSVKDQERLRRQLWESQSAFQVVKNSLLQRVLKDAGMSVPDGALAGPTALGFCFEDVTTVVKILSGFADETELLAFKGGLLGSQFIGVEDVKILADLPSREVLLARVVGGMQSPIGGLVNVLAGPLRSLANVLQARADQLEGLAS